MSDETPAFLAYDYETNNSNNHGHNSILQAAFREYNKDLNPVGDGEVLISKLGLNYANPGAIAVHGLSPKDLQKDGMSELEMAHEIKKRFSEAEDLSVAGYNSHNFDDKVTQHYLFANAQEPYVIPSSGRGDSKDIFKLVHLAVAAGDDSLEIPLKENGKPSLKLETLSEANGIAHTNAHDALSDVDATMGLAKHIKTNSPDLWNAFQESTGSDEVKNLLENKGSPLIRITSSPHGVHSTPVMPVIDNPDNFNEVLGVKLDKPTELKKILDSFSPKDIAGVLNAESADRPKGFKSDSAWPFVKLKVNNGAPLLDVADETSSSVNIVKGIKSGAESKASDFMNNYEENPDNKSLTEKQFDRMFAKIAEEFLQDDMKAADLPYGLKYDKIESTFDLLSNHPSLLLSSNNGGSSLQSYLLKSNEGKSYDPSETYRDALHEVKPSAADKIFMERIATPHEDTGMPPLVDISAFKAAAFMSSSQETHLELFVGLKFDTLLSVHGEITRENVSGTLKGYLDDNPSPTSKYEVLMYVDILNDRLDRFESKEGDYLSITDKNDLGILEVQETKPESYAANRQSLADAEEHNRQLGQVLEMANGLREDLQKEVPKPLTEFLDDFLDRLKTQEVRYGANEFRSVEVG